MYRWSHRIFGYESKKHLDTDLKETLYQKIARTQIAFRSFKLSEPEIQN